MAHFANEVVKGGHAGSSDRHAMYPPPGPAQAHTHAYPGMQVKPEIADVKIHGNQRGELRKGKWTPEEENFVSRLIEHFNMGLLMLPEGTTLRAYLADKLNCDPMRITKKFTGSDCLGKRVYQPRNLSGISPEEIQQARQDLEHLEKRFLLRLQRADDVDACMLDFDARFVYGDHVVSSPAIDALILQSRGGRWGLVSESDLMAAPSPITQLLAGGTYHTEPQSQSTQHTPYPPQAPPSVQSRNQAPHPPPPKAEFAPVPLHKESQSYSASTAKRHAPNLFQPASFPLVGPSPYEKTTEQDQPLPFPGPSQPAAAEPFAPPAQGSSTVPPGAMSGPQKKADHSQTLGPPALPPPFATAQYPGKTQHQVPAPAAPGDFIIGDEETHSPSPRDAVESAAPTHGAHQEDQEKSKSPRDPQDSEPSLLTTAKSTNGQSADSETEAGELVLDFFNSVRHEANSHENIREAAEAWEEKEASRKRKQPSGGQEEAEQRRGARATPH